MAKPLGTKVGMLKGSIRIIADARLRDFEALWKAGHFHSAVYMAGYAVEGYLKCAICKTLKIPQLPTDFEFHNLEPLLFYSGFYYELMSDTVVHPSFLGIQKFWKVEMRYDDPTLSSIDDKTCILLDTWLNDSVKGLVPWFRSRL
ncbi:MAG TPA: hypothetical protein VKX17_02125 [Planctomycetota bacterium]|nr:hypothetical protein [Planctomycetota bacterium]